MFKNNKQVENLYTFLARKFHSEKNNPNVHAGMRLVYRIVKAYDGKAALDHINHDVAKIVPMWMLAQGTISVNGCLGSLIQEGFVVKTSTTYAVIDHADGATSTVAD